MTQENSENPVDVIGAYDAIAPMYAEYSSGKQAYLNAVDDIVIKNLKPSDRLLDIGAGDGRRLAKIKSAVGIKDAIAIEPSPEMAKICEKAANVTVHRVFAEKIDTLDIGKFNAVTALWNVFGHVGNSEMRLKALKNIAVKLEDDGVFILDVNNRHNASAYGKWNVFLRVLVDSFNFKESRGDVTYDWKIGADVVKSRGHLFTPSEIESLFTKAGLRIVSNFSVNYLTGKIFNSKYRGQLFYTLKKI